MEHAKAIEAFRSLKQGQPARLQLVFQKGTGSITSLRRLMVRKGVLFDYDEATATIVLAVIMSYDWEDDENRKVVINIPVVCMEFIEWFSQNQITRGLESIAVVH